MLLENFHDFSDVISSFSLWKCECQDHNFHLVETIPRLCLLQAMFPSLCKKLLHCVLLLGPYKFFQSSSEADVSWIASRAIKPDSGPRIPTPDWASASPFLPNVPDEAFTSMTRPSPNYRIYHNLWFHNMKWFAFLPADQADDPSIEDGLSPNAVVVRMPITDMKNYTRQLRVCGFFLIMNWF
jgi:hypothetical protein